MDHPTILDQHAEERAKKKEQSIPVSTLKGLITIVLVLGIIAGGTAGTVASVLLMRQGLPQGMDQNLSPSKSETVVVDQSSMVKTISAASESVVSIIVEKPSSQVNGSANANPFFNFDIPGFNFVPQNPSGSATGPDNSTPQNDDYVEVSAGTGFIVSNDGLILTNKHVVTDPNARYTIVTKEGDKYQVKILGTDPVNDLALVKPIDDSVKLPAPLDLGDSDQIQIGQQVIAIGNSLGEFSHTVTSGIVSGINRHVTAGDGQGFSEELEEVIQTDAAINPGNSGGPLLNAVGQVIGVNTAVSQQGQLIGFAIPINDALNFIHDIQQYGKVLRPYLGVRYVLVDDRTQKLNNLSVNYGALIRRGQDVSELAVIPGSPADKAGLQENDIILEVNGTKVGVDHSLARLLSNFKPGDKVMLTVERDGKQIQLQVTLGEFQDTSNQ